MPPYFQSAPSEHPLPQASPLPTNPSGLGWTRSALGALCPLPGHGQPGRVEQGSFQSSCQAGPHWVAPVRATIHACFLTSSTQGKIAATTATTAMRVMSRRARERQQNDRVELGAGDASENSARLRRGRTLSCSPRGIPWRLMMKI